MSIRSRVRVGVEASLCIALLVGAPPPGRADGPWSGTVAVTTDYVFRGVSQTYGDAALQAGLNYQSPAGWFGGAWASNVEPYPFGSNSAEIDVYTGFGWLLSPEWTARASYTRYLYAWDHRPAAYDSGEFAVTVGLQDRLSATVSWQPDDTGYSALGYARHRQSFAYELTGRWPLPKAFALVGGVGYYDLSRLYGTSYWSGDAGVSYSHGRLEVDLMRFFSDATVRRLFEDASADGRWAATAVFRF
jgi:uncharacterized protein (TIGR02001 family)